jgi:hypothetical protein
MLGGMRPRFLDAPAEWFFALLMAASPMIGSIWVHPVATFWSVFGVGAATTLGVLIVGAKPSKPSQTPG